MERKSSTVQERGMKGEKGQEREREQDDSSKMYMYNMAISRCRMISFSKKAKDQIKHMQI